MADRESKIRQLNDALSTHYHKVRSLFGFWRWHGSVVDDLTQEVFVRLWLAIDEGREIQDVQAFIGGIAFNVSREQMRKRSRNRELESDASVKLIEGPENRSTELTDQHRLLRKLIAKLDAEDQEIILAVFYWGFNGSELGELLGIPRQTALSRLHRTVDRIRAMPESKGLQQ